MTKEIAASPSRPVTFELLGPVEAYVGNQRLDLGTDRDKRLLVALLLSRGQPIERDKLKEWVWDDPLPESAADELSKLMHGLRSRLGEAGLRNVLINKGRLCRLDIPAESVDVHRFDDLTSRARVLGAGDQKAADLLDEALRLCRGQPLTGLPGRRVENYRITLIEKLHDAELSFNEIAIRSGHYRERIPTLARMLHERPNDESVASLYMQALYGAGRQQDALDVYKEVYRHVVEELGGILSARLTDLQRRILQGDGDFLVKQDAVQFSADQESEAADSGTAQEANTERPDRKTEPHPAADSETVVRGTVYGSVVGRTITADQVATTIYNHGPR